MKKILFYLVSTVIIILYGCSENSSKNKALETLQKTSMEIDTVFDAGTVVKGEIIRATFKVRNTGNYPLIFGDLSPSCGCTVASSPKKPIQPGETSQITAEVNTANLTSKQINK